MSELHQIICDICKQPYLDGVDAMPSGKRCDVYHIEGAIKRLPKGIHYCFYIDRKSMEPFDVCRPCTIKEFKKILAKL